MSFLFHCAYCRDFFQYSLFPSHSGAAWLALFSSSTKSHTRLKCLNRLRGGLIIEDCRCERVHFIGVNHVITG